MPVAYGGNNTRGPIEVGTTLTAHGGAGRMDFESETFVAHTLRGEGFDASEDGTGRGTPLVPVGADVFNGLLTGNVAATMGANSGQSANHSGPSVLVPFDTTQITSAANRSNPKAGDPCHPLAAGAHAPAIAFDARQSDVLYYGDKAGPLDTGIPSATAMIGAAVRRLMPVECERLQGFPDGYTAIPWRGKVAADGFRYKALGNSWAVNCARWIGQRISFVDSIKVAAHERG